MSKRKHKNRSDTRREGTSDNRNNANVNANTNSRPTYNNGPFGINPNQLLSSMFGNIDMNQINSLLQSMNTQGFDFNNLNLGNLMGAMNPMGSSMNQNSNGMNFNKESNNDEEETSEVVNDDILDGKVDRNDENIQMLKAIRSIVNGERGAFIDKIILMYNDGVFDE